MILLSCLMEQGKDSDKPMKRTKVSNDVLLNITRAFDFMYLNGHALPPLGYWALSTKKGQYLT